MVILYLYDKINGYRYRKLSYAYYLCNLDSKLIVSAWLVKED